MYPIENIRWFAAKRTCQTNRANQSYRSGHMIDCAKLGMLHRIKLPTIGLTHGIKLPISKYDVATRQQ